MVPQRRICPTVGLCEGSLVSFPSPCRCPVCVTQHSAHSLTFCITIAVVGALAINCKRVRSSLPWQRISSDGLRFSVDTLLLHFCCAGRPTSYLSTDPWHRRAAEEKGCNERNRLQRVRGRPQLRCQTARKVPRRCIQRLCSLHIRGRNPGKIRHLLDLYRPRDG